jgi:hypothetical protein
MTFLPYRQDVELPEGKNKHLRSWLDHRKGVLRIDGLIPIHHLLIVVMLFPIFWLKTARWLFQSVEKKTT